MTEPQDPSELLDGVAQRPDEVHLDDAAQAALDAVASAVQANMAKTQGPWREKSAIARYWLIGAAALVGAGFVFALAPSQLNSMLFTAVCLAALTAVVCFAAVVMAPSRPALSERLALGGIGIAGLAFGAEVYGGSLLGDGGFNLMMAIKCSGKWTAGAIIPLVLLVVGLRRTGFPVRILHAVAMTAAALSLASVGIWRACTPADMMHICLSHVLLPAILIPAAGFVVWKVSRMRSTISVP